APASAIKNGSGGELLRSGLGSGGEQRLSILGDSLANRVEGQIIWIVAKGILDFDADFVNAEHPEGEHGRGDWRVPMDGVDHREWRGKTEERDETLDVLCIGEWDRSFYDPLRTAHAVEQRGDVRVHRLEPLLGEASCPRACGELVRNEGGNDDGSHGDA